VGMTGADCQESGRSCSHSLIAIARIAAAAAIPAAAIAMRGTGLGGAKGGEQTGGDCGGISGLVSGVSGGEMADASAGRVL